MMIKAAFHWRTRLDFKILSCAVAFLFEYIKLVRKRSELVTKCSFGFAQVVLCLWTQFSSWQLQNFVKVHDTVRKEEE